MAKRSKFGKPPSQRSNRPVRGDRYDPNDLRYIATHEAGHAVAAVVLGLDLAGVDIRRRRLPGGRVSIGFTDCKLNTRDVMGKGEHAAMPRLVQLMAGPLAESAVNPAADYGSGPSSDLEGARQVAVIAICEAVLDGTRSQIDAAEQRRNEPRIIALLDSAEVAAADLVRNYDQAITRVASLLLEREVLSGEDVADVVSKNLIA